MTRSNRPQTRRIKVEALPRVEGEGALYVRLRDDAVQQVELRIYEPPRFIEALLRGRMYTDARIQRIYGGTNEIMKEVISRSL